METLLDALRQATGEDHRLLHRHPLFIACQEKRLHVDDYVCLLKAFYSSWLVLLPAIDLVPIDVLKPYLINRFKSLENDLNSLNVDLSKIKPPSTLVATTKDECLGACYVLVGSSLGATVLSENIHVSLKSVPISYMSFSPQESGWPLLVNQLQLLDAKQHFKTLFMAQKLFQLVYILLTERQAKGLDRK